MGFIGFALKGNYKRHYKNLKNVSQKTGKSTILMFIDTAVSALVFKSGLQDYLNYEFYNKSFSERKTYATIGYQNKFYELAANVKYAPFFSNKVNFHKNFSEFTKREFVSYDDGFSKVKDFISSHKEFVRKPISGLGGQDVVKLASSDIKDMKTFYEKLKEENCLLEELVVQDAEWSKLNPNSINTLRIVTKCIGGKSEILFAVARIGAGKTIADNFHQGGVGVKINTAKGILEGEAIDKEGNVSKETSVTHVKVNGYKIPYWKEIKKMVNKAAKVNDNVNVIGWDIAISKDGPLIIEGNRGPGMDLVQVLYKRGVKPDLEKVKKEIIAYQRGR